MAYLINRIETTIKSEEPAGFFSIETLLKGLSTVYGALAQAKRFGFEKKILPKRKLPCVVISIGNITVGGTGKTPMTLYLANLVTSLGLRVVVLSRGYKGNAEKCGGIVSDGKALLMSPKEAGDEPFLMASTLKGVPVVVGQNRFQSGSRAIAAFAPDVIILDDGFQHMKLDRDIDLLLVDHHSPFGNRHLLPRGPLREPVSALKRADIIIETRSGSPDQPGMELKAAMCRLSLKTPVFQSIHEPYIAQVIPAKQPVMSNSRRSDQAFDFSRLKGKRIFAFSGLAGNRNFHRTLAEIGCNLIGYEEFPDHYWYKESDLSALQQAAIGKQAELMLTTQKDAARIPLRLQWPLDLVVIGITPSFGDQTPAFENFIKGKLLMAKHR